MTDAIERAARVIAECTSGDVNSVTAAHIAQALSDAGMLDQGWRPIAEYDALPDAKRPTATFWFRELRDGRNYLGPMAEFQRHYGRRVATHWRPLPTPPVEREG